MDMHKHLVVQVFVLHRDSIPPLGLRSSEAQCESSGRGPGLLGYRAWMSSMAWSLLTLVSCSQVRASHPHHLMRYCSQWWNMQLLTMCSTSYSGSLSITMGLGRGIYWLGIGSPQVGSRRETCNTGWTSMVVGRLSC
jgi:hypothetical protein